MCLTLSMHTISVDINVFDFIRFLFLRYHGTAELCFFFGNTMNHLRNLAEVFLIIFKNFTILGLCTMKHRSTSFCGFLSCQLYLNTESGASSFYFQFSYKNFTLANTKDLLIYFGIDAVSLAATA